ncbi:MAG: hypothetical protein JO053_03935 [Acidobacteria bacterium]|nr:hypothetical protein [Acidobacteriota bacterium]
MFFCLAAMLLPATVRPFETDQYNLPTTPLADIGDEVSEYVEQNLRAAVDEINADIRRHQACLTVVSRRSDCHSPEKETTELTELRSNDAVAKALYERLGDGTMLVTKFGGWFRGHKFKAQPATYYTSFKDSIYIALPTDYWTISPTIKMYGVEFGTDKLEHLFQQGYRYYKIERGEAAITIVPGRSVKKAVKWGQNSERTFYGFFVSGVYSNADLAANFAGMRFYQRLTSPVKIGETTEQPLLSLKEGVWQFNTANLRDELLKPFLSDHLNEALNPSVYAFNLYPVVKSVVQNHSCAEWHKAYPNLSRSILEQKTNDLELWHGEDYGNSQKERMVRIADTCF